MMEGAIDTKSEKEEKRKSFEEKVLSNPENKKVDITYVNIEQEDKMLEIDLVYVRQKGESEKFLEITLTSVESVQGQMVPVHSVFEIRSKEEFLKLKDYFCNLNWD